ncbi:MAG: sigma-54 dependent transcriptional regulator [Verrucomicrobiia bacterium]|jgi:DNA-binding NtrC family response regulator
MATVLHPEDFACVAEERLKRLGVVCRAFPIRQVADISHDSTELVYLLPHEIMAAGAWAKLRVRLAQANRLFIGYVPTASTAGVVQFLRDGAYDVLAMDDTDERWKSVIVSAVENQKLWLQLYGGKPLSAGDVLTGRSEVVRDLRQKIDRLGPTDVCVLIQGESGVGKERVAAALHKAGRGGPYMALNCAAIPKDLLEAELFGVEKGAYTGALKARAGLVEQAEGGMLFLDEVGEMELSLQPKLLRFIETRRARRIGGEREYSVKLRLISATNRDLEAAVASGKFRPDLYYRLAEITVRVPPLRTRLDDIPELALTFLHQANERFGKNFETLEPGLIERFQQYCWPGNVRELKSAIDRLALMFDGPMLRATWWDMPAGVIEPSTTQAAPARDAAASVQRATPPNSTAALPNSRQKLALARKLLAESNNDYSWVCAQLGINPSTLYRWRKTGKLD